MYVYVTENYIGQKDQVHFNNYYFKVQIWRTCDSY